jgi:hypothetical protein
MVTMMVLALAITVQDSSQRHVRATEPRILALIDAGISRSPVFRSLVAALDESDVIVYIEPKILRQNLGGYLRHHIVAQGGYRYLRIVIEMQGSQGRLIPLLAHELQHALEIARSPAALDARRMQEVFERRDVGCGGSTCFETLAALEVQSIVDKELKAPKASSAE